LRRRKRIRVDVWRETMRRARVKISGLDVWQETVGLLELLIGKPTIQRDIENSHEVFGGCLYG
jgi:hypothetical protein